jgi:hypothetical protein
MKLSRPELKVHDEVWDDAMRAVYSVMEWQGHAVRSLTLLINDETFTIVHKFLKQNLEYNL